MKVNLGNRLVNLDMPDLHSRHEALFTTYLDEIKAKIKSASVIGKHVLTAGDTWNGKVNWVVLARFRRNGDTRDGATAPLAIFSVDDGSLLITDDSDIIANVMERIDADKEDEHGHRSPDDPVKVCDIANCQVLHDPMFVLIAHNAETQKMEIEWLDEDREPFPWLLEKVELDRLADDGGKVVE